MKRKWWNEKVAYQIYPKSFCDSNGDGIGDLKGIISKLDYLEQLGIDVIWLSPVYQSPFVDQGYDISDYYNIADEFGTMEDFDTLLTEAKKRGIDIIMDLVINHCSDKHEWFQKALKAPNSEYGQYFYFEKGKDDAPPSNYRSYFGGSTWEKVDGTDLYYLHMFAKEQPDLNWENPVVREKLFEMVNWWLEKGIAGFRIDAIINIKKDLSFPSFPADGPDGLCACTKMIEETHGIGDFLTELKEKTFAKHDAFTVGEVFNMHEDELEEFVGDDGYFSTMFDFAPHILTQGEHGWYDAPAVDFEAWKSTIIQSQLDCQDKAFLANIIENHDEPRGASRYLPKYAQNPAGKKMLGTINLLLRGIPFIYQGQEIGMTNCRMESIDEYDDIDTKNQYQTAINAGFSESRALDACFRHSRDNARTPMQWSDAPQGGFTSGKPWLRTNDNYSEINVASQSRDPDSVLSYYKKLIALRKSSDWKDVLVHGTFEPAFQDTKNLFAFYRVLDNHQVLILTNFGEKELPLTLPDKNMNVLLSNLNRKTVTENKIILKSCEALVLG